MKYILKAYTESSTNDPSAEITKESLEDFVKANNTEIGSLYIESKPSATLSRPKLIRLLDDCKIDDIILIDDINILRNLENEDWEKLKDAINFKSLRIVAVNIYATHSVLLPSNSGGVEKLNTINKTIIEVLGVINKHDRYLEGCPQGINKSKPNSNSKGKKPDLALYKSIVNLSDAGKTYEEITQLLNCSSTTISRAKKWHSKI